MKRSVTVKVAGQTLNLKTEDDPKYVRALADHLEERIESIRRGADAVSAHQVALLAGLTLVDELFRTQRALAETGVAVRGRIERALRLLDEPELS